MTTLSVRELIDAPFQGDDVRVQGMLLVDAYNCAFLGVNSDSYENGSLIRLKGYDAAIEKIFARFGACVGGPLTIQLLATIEGQMERYELVGDGRVLHVHAIEFADSDGVVCRIDAKSGTATLSSSAMEGGQKEGSMETTFTNRATKVLALANEEAQRHQHDSILPEHILLGLVRQGTGVGANVLKNLELDLTRVRVEVEALLKPGPTSVGTTQLPQSSRVKTLIEYGLDEARKLNHRFFGTEHLLLGLLREDDGPSAQVLKGFGLELAKVRDEVLNILGM